MFLAEYEVQSDRDLTIALLADLHEENPKHALKLLKQIQPDLVCIAGDSFERQNVGENPCKKEPQTRFQRQIHQLAMKVNDWIKNHKQYERQTNPENIYQFLKEVAAIPDQYGKKNTVYLSLGNHEWYLTEQDQQVLWEANIHVLDNLDVWNQKHEIRVAGLSSRVDEAWLSAFEQKPGYKILLCHHPEYYKPYLKNRKIDLILSGHAHGGQMRIFGRGIFAPGQGLFPKYHHGIYENKLIVSAGCTNTAALPRWGNPCEVVIIRLKKK